MLQILRRKVFCSGLPEAKLKEGVFVGPDICTLMKDKAFESKIQANKKKAWNAFRYAVLKFLGNQKDPNFKRIVRKMLTKFNDLGCSMSLNVHFLASHLDYYPENLGAVREEQGERFHQDIKEMERRYQGRWNVMAYYCWTLRRDESQAAHKRKSSKRSFKGKKKRYYKDL